MEAGAPDFINTDAVTNSNCSEFKKNVADMGTIVRVVPTEGHDCIGIVDRSYAYLRTVYEKSRTDLPNIY